MLARSSDYSDAGQPVIVTPILMAGANVAQWAWPAASPSRRRRRWPNRARPAHPAGHAKRLWVVPDNTDMQSGSPAFGTPSLRWGSRQPRMRAHYNLPSAVARADIVEGPDAQAAYESMMSCGRPSSAASTSWLHAAGWLRRARSSPPMRKFVIDVEQLRMFEWILGHGLPVDGEGLAMDALRESSGRPLLGTEHTMRHYRHRLLPALISSTEKLRPLAAFRLAHDRCGRGGEVEADGSPTIRIRDRSGGGRTASGVHGQAQNRRSVKTEERFGKLLDALASGEPAPASGSAAAAVVAVSAALLQKVASGRLNGRGAKSATCEPRRCAFAPRS